MYERKIRRNNVNWLQVVNDLKIRLRRMIETYCILSSALLAQTNTIALKQLVMCLQGEGCKSMFKFKAATCMNCIIHCVYNIWICNSRVRLYFCRGNERVWKKSRSWFSLDNWQEMVNETVGIKKQLTCEEKQNLCLQSAHSQNHILHYQKSTT